MRALRQCGSPSGAKTTTTSIRTQPAPGSGVPVMGDLIEFVDFNYVAQVARLNAATLATLAAAPREPQKVTIVNKMTENGTTLTWEPQTGGGVAHDEVLWRETTSTNWQYVKQLAATSTEGAGDGVAPDLQGQRDLRYARPHEWPSRAGRRSLKDGWRPECLRLDSRVPMTRLSRSI